MSTNKQKQRRRPASSGVRSGSHKPKAGGAASKRKASTPSAKKRADHTPPDQRRAGSTLCRECGDDVVITERDGLYFARCGCKRSFAFTTPEGAAAGRRIPNA